MNDKVVLVSFAKPNLLFLGVKFVHIPIVNTGHEILPSLVPTTEAISTLSVVTDVACDGDQSRAEAKGRED